MPYTELNDEIINFYLKYNYKIDLFKIKLLIKMKKTIFMYLILFFSIN